MSFKILLCLVLSLSLIACEKSTNNEQTQSENATKLVQASAQKVVEEEKTGNALEHILESQPEEVKARYKFRHPDQTLTFFGIQPGMTVVEALPGGGWYSKLLLPLLGEEGNLIGADYPSEIWPKFGFFSDEQIEAKKTWSSDWPKEVEAWGIKSPAKVSAFAFGSLPSSMESSADAVLFVRALHNLARFNADGGFLDAALADAYKVLKPGGIVGIVQHQARENTSDEWAQGKNGYIKKTFLIEKMQAAGFKLLDESTINENPKDVPGESDIVWRLPPVLSTSKEKPEVAEEMKKIGESHRMTLKFQKPV